MTKLMYKDVYSVSSTTIVSKEQTGQWLRKRGWLLKMEFYASH